MEGGDMKKVILTKGLPASGKSTWAKELLAKEQGWKRVNKDDLRAMLDNGKWSKENEKFVLKIRDELILSTLNQGFNVIVDDTNLHHKHEQQIKELIKGKAGLEIKDFTDISLDECIRRDQKRSNYVGEKVIKDMHKQYLVPKALIVAEDPALPEVVLCDLDGTLALFAGENPYERDFTKDKINSSVWAVISMYQKQARGNIIFVSGRKNKFLDQTKEWLRENCVSYNDIYMPRADDDNRKDVILKQEIYEKNIKGKYNVLFVLDDRNQVVEFWRSVGLTCLQVAEGDF
jgi:predicted kinase